MKIEVANIKSKFSDLKQALESQLEQDTDDEEIDQLRLALTELHALNEFLQEANQQLQTDVTRLKATNKDIP
jgi:hypothetical protein